MTHFCTPPKCEGEKGVCVYKSRCRALVDNSDINLTVFTT